MNKKTLYIIYFSTLLFLSCSFSNTDSTTDKVYDHIFYNDSTYMVQCTIDGASYTINAGDSLTVRGSYSLQIEIIGHPRVTLMGTRNGVFTEHVSSFVNMTAYTYSVFNSSAYTITLSESNGALTDSYGGTVTVTAGSTATVTIYSKSPSLTAIYENTYPANCVVSNYKITLY